MTLTLGQVEPAFKVLQRLATERLNAKVAYRIAKLLTALAPEADHFTKERNKLIEAHGAPVEDKPGAFQVTDDRLAAYVAAVEELAAVSVDVPGAPLTLEGLACPIEPIEILALGPLVAEG